MKKLCCWILVFLSILTIVFSVTAVVPSAEPLTASDYAINDLLEHFPFENIAYSYISSGNSYSSSIDYSDALLLQDASNFSPELAKSSVALAMAAYSSSNVNSDYTRPNVNSLLQNMGFEAYDNAYVYSRSENNLTLEDNDYVAYTVAVKELIHPYTKETYIIYAVPIQGTTANAEWFSNFNLGTGSEHMGFQKASTEVYQTLKGYFSTDGAMDADHRIVWLTGHSRGAACANLVAGWLSRDDEQYTTMEHVYGYTFACPAVSLYADTTLHNIYNFNNDGDLISKIPMANWQYKRYGQDITLDNDSLHFDNLKQRYKSVTGQTYAGMQTGTSYDTLLTNILGNNRDVYYESSFLQLVLAIAGWGLGGKNDAEFGEVLTKYLDDNSADIVSEALKSYVGSKTDLDEIYSFLKSVLTDKDGLADWASSAYSATYGMTEEQFTQYLSSNISKIAKLEDASGVGIETPDSLLLAHNELLNDSSKIETVTDCIQAANDLLFDGDGNVMNKITHGHCQATYVLWINSMFYGDRGWYNNNSITNVEIPETVTNIGIRAFSSCDSLQTLVLPQTPIALGNSAFGSCEALRAVTLPVDTDYSQNPFYETTKVTTIHYTYGLTGVMPNYTDTYNAPNNYNNSLQYISKASLQNVDFEEGVTQIGNYAFYRGNYSGAWSALRNVKLPTTLKSIGSFAFSKCDSLSTISLPEGLTELGSACFSDCCSLTKIRFNGNTPAIANDSFYNSAFIAIYQHNNPTWTRTARQNYGGTVTWQAAGLGDVLKWNIVLEDDFKINFYIKIFQEATSTGQVMVSFDKKISFNIQDLPKSQDGYYIVSASVAATQMRIPVSVQVIDSENYGEVFTYNVRQYCDTILADEAHNEYHALVKEMLNYGAMAQVYFDYDAENLANDGITGTAATDVPETAEDLTVTDKISGLSFYGASLVYRDRIAVRYYFTGDVTGCTFVANGNTYTPVAKDGMYYIEIADILPQDLDQQITLTVTDVEGNTMSVTYGPMNYIVRMNQKDNVNLKNLLKALYNYHLAAKALTA